MTFKKLVKQLEDQGMDTCELNCMLEALYDADNYNDCTFYEGQLYGFLCGLAALKYIDEEIVLDIMENTDNGIY